MIHKFVAMMVHPHVTDQVWTRPDDPRVMSLDRVLRRYRCDEIPRLADVLKRNMNIMGPGTKQPRIFIGLLAEVGHHIDRQRALPEITR